MAQTRHIMKKIFLGLALLLSFTGAVFAQTSMLATLSHEGEITVFYGPEALRKAHAAATHGDVISLSAGKFYSVDITKAITLRGAGTVTDVEKNIHPTNIIGDFNIDIEEGVTQSLTIEGIYTKYDIEIISGLKNAYFIKNRLGKINYCSNTASYNNNHFIHCKIPYGFTAQYNSGRNSIFFTNSYIYSLKPNLCTIIANNSIICSSIGSNSLPTLQSLSNCTIYNSILVGDNSGASHNVLPVDCNVYNCIITNVTQSNISGYSYEQIFNNTDKNNSRVIKDLSSVFKTASVGYNTGIVAIDVENLELLDEVKSNYIGTDSTEIGIYGGLYPYSPITTGPQITKCNVAPRASADGKLSIEIEVKAGE